MSHPVILQELSSQLGRLESEITAMRHTLEKLQQDTGFSTPRSAPNLTNKISLSEQMQQFFHHFSITGQSIGPKMLQEQMYQTPLNRNKLSQSLIEARG